MQREAVARCPECARFFCRECITEHADLVICAACLRNQVKPAGYSTGRFGGFLRFGHFLFGFLILYLTFYYFAQVLLAIPAEFHEGTLWQTGWWTGK
jgi:hypothetical protein